MKCFVRLFLLTLWCGVAAAAPSPNIVFIISDDHDFEHLGFMGNDQVQTPHLDRLAEAGTVFENGYIPMSICRPTLATFLTGQLPHQNGIYTNYLQERGVGNDTIHSDPQHSIANLLKDAGYATYASGKFWEGDAREQGFTHGTAEVSFGGFLQFVRKGQEELFGFIDEHAGKQPMFVWWAPLLPHLPHNPPDKYLKLYPADEIRIPDYVKPERRESFVEDERKLLAMTTWFDEGVGELIRKLKEASAYDDTLFVFVIDNGWANGLPSKHSVGEKSIRTPMSFTFPGKIQSGRRIEAVKSTMDLYPTMLRYAGVEVPDWAAGQTLKPVLESEAEPESDIVIGAIYPHWASETGPDAAKDLLAFYHVSGQWKTVWHIRDFTRETVGIPEGQATLWADFVPRQAGEANLFDLHSDPDEQTDLAGHPAHRARIEEARSEVLAWWRKTGGDPLPEAVIQFQ